MQQNVINWMHLWTFHINVLLVVNSEQRLGDAPPIHVVVLYFVYIHFPTLTNVVHLRFVAWTTA